MYTLKRKSKKFKSGFSWSVRFNYEDSYGIVKQFSKSGFETKKQALDFGTKKKMELEENGGILYNIDKTFNEVYEEYMEVEGFQKYAPSTILMYQSKFKNYIKNDIGQIKIKDLHYAKLQKYFNKFTEGTKGTHTNIKKVFCVTFKYALRCGYIKENPMPMIEVRGDKEETEKDVITYEQLESLVDSLLTTKQGKHVGFSCYSMCIFLYIGYYLGTRKAETLALTKDDIDFDNDFVYIDKQLEYLGLTNNEFHSVNRMKTKDSKSKLPLCLPLKQILQEWFKYNPYDLICCKEDGSFMNPTTINHTLSENAKSLGFYFTSHMLRHTFITNLVNSGVDVKTTSKLARHSNVTTTLQVYTHVSEKNLENAIDTTFNKEKYIKSDKKVTNCENPLLN